MHTYAIFFLLWQVWSSSAEQKHLLMVSCARAAADDTSMDILQRELAAAYSAALHAAQPQWQPLSSTYVHHAAWQRAHLAGAALEAELSWWQQTLADAPPLLDLLSDRPRPDAMSFTGAQLNFHIPAHVQRDLQQLATAQQTTVFVVVLAALQARVLLAAVLISVLHART